MSFHAKIMSNLNVKYIENLLTTAITRNESFFDIQPMTHFRRYARCMKEGGGSTHHNF